jgi:hypothetical protein
MRHTGRILTAVLAMAFGAGCTTEIVQHDVRGQGQGAAGGEDSGEGLGGEENGTNGSTDLQNDMVSANTTRFGSGDGSGDGSGSGGSGEPSYSATVTTNSSSYTFGQTVSISFGNLPGNDYDWIGIAPQGAANEIYSWFQYSFGATSGTFVPLSEDTLPPGTYVARAFKNDSYEKIGESASFTVGAMGDLPATVNTGKQGYTGLEAVGITFGAFADSGADWVGAYRPSGSMMSVDTWTYTNGTSGSASLANLYAGSWEIRAFANDSYTLKGRSPTFTVTPAIKADRASYASSDTIEIEFGGASGHYEHDEVRLVHIGSSSSNTVQTWTTDWHARGTIELSASELSGSYVAKLCFKNTTKATTGECQATTTFTVN